MYISVFHLLPLMVNKCWCNKGYKIWEAVIRIWMAFWVLTAFCPTPCELNSWCSEKRNIWRFYFKAVKQEGVLSVLLCLNWEVILQLLHSVLLGSAAPQSESAICMHTSALLDFFPIYVTTDFWVKCPVLNRRFSSIICFIHGSGHMSVPVSQFILPHASLLGNPKFVLYIYASISALPTCLPVPFSWIPHICVFYSWIAFPDRKNSSIEVHEITTTKYRIPHM